MPRYGLGGFPPYCGVLALLPSRSEQREDIAVLGYLGRNTSDSSLNSANRDNRLKKWYSWVVKTSEALLRPQHTPWPLSWPWHYGPWSV